jgi:hypothetical protein
MASLWSTKSISRGQYAQAADCYAISNYCPTEPLFLGPFLILSPKHCPLVIGYANSLFFIQKEHIIIGASVIISSRFFILLKAERSTRLSLRSGVHILGSLRHLEHIMGANAHQWVLRTAAKTLALVWHTICSSLSLKSRSCLPLSFLFLPVSGVFCLLL